MHMQSCFLYTHDSVGVRLDCHYFLLFMQNPTPPAEVAIEEHELRIRHVDTPPLLPGEVDTEL